MSWKPQLQKGKFRDAEFYTRGSDGVVGRRTVAHEYPLRDKPFVEDLGRKAREFTLELYVLGADYMAARDRLVEALEKPGPGTLIHHWMGTLSVVPTSCRISESSDQGGVARFTVTFTEAGDNTYPSAGANSKSAVNRAADAAMVSEIKVFSGNFSLKGAASFVQNAASTLATLNLNRLISLAGGYVGADVSGFLSTARTLRASVTSLLFLPSSFASQLTGLYTQFGGIADVFDSRKTRSSYQTMAAYDPSAPITQTTSNRQWQAANQTALVGLMQRAALIEEARTTRLIPFESYNEAASIRDSLAERMDTAMEAAPDEAYQALQTLRAAMVQDITARGADLSRIVSYTPKTTRPALALAYSIYGEAEQEADLIARNRSIRHPGFVTGGRPLEIISP